MSKNPKTLSKRPFFKKIQKIQKHVKKEQLNKKCFGEAIFDVFFILYTQYKHEHKKRSPG